MHQSAGRPGIGHLREGLADAALRVWTVHSSLVLSRPDAQPLRIVSILSGYPDVATLLG
jgi:hypothetical protein